MNAKVDISSVAWTQLSSLIPGELFSDSNEITKA